MTPGLHTRAAFEAEVLERLDIVAEDLRVLRSTPKPDVPRLPGWLDLDRLAVELGVGVRWLKARKAEGMPHRKIAGKLRFRVRDVEPWLRDRGHMEDAT